MPKKTDRNHSSIVRDLRGIGASVQSLASIGKGCPDILVGFRGRNFVFEIKDPEQPPSRRNLTRDELNWHEGWRGQVKIVETFSQILEIISPKQQKDLT